MRCGSRESRKRNRQPKECVGVVSVLLVGMDTRTCDCPMGTKEEWVGRLSL